MTAFRRKQSGFVTSLNSRNAAIFYEKRKEKREEISFNPAESMVE